MTGCEYYKRGYDHGYRAAEYDMTLKHFIRIQWRKFKIYLMRRF